MIVVVCSVPDDVSVVSLPPFVVLSVVAVEVEVGDGTESEVVVAGLEVVVPGLGDVVAGLGDVEGPPPEQASAPFNVSLTMFG